jgi:hypothetical protein
MGGYAVNPVIAGLINGTHLALAVKQQHLEQQAQQMQKQRQDRQAKVEDLQTRMGLLQSGAQPTQMSGAGPEVPNGATVHAPGATINGVEVGGSDQAAPRPVDPGRTVSYGGTSYYVPTPNEQFQQQLPILQAQANLKTQSDLATKSGEAAITHSYDNVQLPGIGTVNKAGDPVLQHAADAGRGEHAPGQEPEIAEGPHRHTRVGRQFSQRCDERHQQAQHRRARSGREHARGK